MVDIHVTERTAFKLCRLYWDFNNRQLLAPHGYHMGPLWFGTGIHVALATYYKFKMEPRKAWDIWIRQQKSDYFAEISGKDLEDFENYRTLGREMMDGYLPYARQNDNWEVVGAEYPLRYEILPGVFLVGSLDLLVRDSTTRKLWVVDHKTCSSFIDPEALTFDDQMVMYLWLVWKVFGEVPGGAIYSMLRKSVPCEPMLVYKGTALSKAKSIDTTYEKYMDAIVRNGFNVDEYREVLERIKDNRFFHREPISRSARELKIFDQQVIDEAKDMLDPFVRIYPTMTQNCTWSCQFTDLCRTRLTGGDVEFTIKARYRQMTEQERYHERWLDPKEIANV